MCSLRGKAKIPNGTALSHFNNDFLLRNGKQVILLPVSFIPLYSTNISISLMRNFLVTILFLLFLNLNSEVKAQEFNQESDTTSDIVLMEKLWTLGLVFNTNGWGLRYRNGKNITFLKQRLWEIDFSTYKSPKEIRSINPYYADARSYVYGKLNSVFFLRGGMGFQHILNSKPYWGGVQLSALYYGGISLGIAKPIYLYIIKIRGINEYELVEEKYNPTIHSVEDIYGRGSLLAGITQLGFYPGVYVKGGLEFEFGTRNKRINSLEAGATLDFSPIPIPIMAYNPKQNFFITLYLSFSLGKRHN
jgi:hypothetical protein